MKIWPNFCHFKRAFHHLWPFQTRFSPAAAALSLVLDYIYTSRVSVSGSAKSVQEIITAAKRLKIQSLIPVCEVLEEALASDQDLTGQSRDFLHLFLAFLLLRRPVSRCVAFFAWKRFCFLQSDSNATRCLSRCSVWPIPGP